MATTRPHSSRKTCSSTGQRLLEDRPDLDRAAARRSSCSSPATARAPSRLSASTTMKPPRKSLLSTNGPSVSSVLPCSWRTVVADSTSWRRSQPVTFGRSRTSAITGGDPTSFLFGSPLASVDVAVDQERVSQDVSFPRRMAVVRFLDEQRAPETDTSPFSRLPVRLAVGRSSPRQNRPTSRPRRRGGQMTAQAGKRTAVSAG